MNATCSGTATRAASRTARPREPSVWKPVNYFFSVRVSPGWSEATGLGETGRLRSARGGNGSRGVGTLGAGGRSGFLSEHLAAALRVRWARYDFAAAAAGTRSWLDVLNAQVTSERRVRCLVSVQQLVSELDLLDGQRRRVGAGNRLRLQARGAERAES